MEEGKEGQGKGGERASQRCVQKNHYTFLGPVAQFESRIASQKRGEEKKKDENRGKTPKERRLRIVMRLKSSVRSLFVWALKLSLTFSLHPLSARLHGQGHKTLYSGGTFFRCVYSRLNFFSDSFFSRCFGCRVSCCLGIMTITVLSWSEKNKKHKIGDESVLATPTDRYDFQITRLRDQRALRGWGRKIPNLPEMKPLYHNYGRNSFFVPPNYYYCPHSTFL